MLAESKQSEEEDALTETDWTQVVLKLEVHLSPSASKQQHQQWSKSKKKKGGVISLGASRYILAMQNKESGTA